MEKQKYSNENIISLVSDIFTIDSIMFMYYSGSINYGFNDDLSDYDVTAIVNGFKGSVEINLPNLDLLVYGSDCYLDRFNLKEEVPVYQIVKMDDLISLDRNLIYINPLYKDKFLEYRSYSFDFKTYLKNFLAFQKIRRLNYNMPDKSMYHIFRVKGMIEYYKKWGKLMMIVEEPLLSDMINFKNNYNNEIGYSYLPKIKEALDFIEEYTKRM